MKSQAFEHYKKFLAEIYSWSLGDKEVLFKKNADWLNSQGITSGKLLDLGAGFGSHAIPAAQKGLDVTAVDFSAELLLELKQNAHEVTTVESDLIQFLEADSNSYDHILCLGDTLTHLNDHKEVMLLIDQIKYHLAPNGRMYLSWRDYKTIPITDENRFITVREESGKKMTCELEDLNDLQIKVTNTFQSKSHSYHKLKVTPWDLRVFCHGMKEVKETVQNRLVEMIFQKD